MAPSKTCPQCGEHKDAAEFYENGRGHLSSWCRPCHNARCDAREQARLATPEGRAKHNERARLWQRRDRLRKMGVPEGEIPAILERQAAGNCEGCGRPAGDESIPNPSARRLHADHDHATGQYRGLLCQRCNSILGLADDNADTLTSLAAYLVKAQQDLSLHLNRDV